MDKMQIDEFIITDVKGNLKINNKDFKLCELIITEKEKINGVEHPFLTDAVNTFYVMVACYILESEDEFICKNSMLENLKKIKNEISNDYHNLEESQEISKLISSYRNFVNMSPKLQVDIINRAIKNIIKYKDEQDK